MNNKQIISFFIFLIFVLVISTLTKVLENKKQLQLIQLLKEGKDKKLENELDSFSTKILIRPFNREFLRLNLYLFQQDDYTITKQFNHILTLRMNSQQKKEVLIRGFEYFLNNKNQKMSLKFLTDIKNMKDKSLIEHSQMMYDILLLKKTNYIEELIDKIKNENKMVKGLYALLISKQYGYLEDYENEKKYLDISKQCIEV